MSNENASAYEAIFEACEEGIVAVNSEGKIALANKSLLQLFGYTIEELVGSTIEKLIPTKVRDKHVKERQHYHKNPQPRRMGVGRDLFALKKDGSEFNVEISLNKTMLNDEEHVIAFVIDISERKKIEEALRKSEEQLILYATQLEERVSKRTEELDKTVKDLEKVNDKLAIEIKERKKAQDDVIKALEKERDLNELKSRFVSMASHEFRTPLSTILSSSSLISKYEKTDQQDKRTKHIDKIKSAITNLTNILNDFLSVAKLEEGKYDIEKKQVSFTEIINEVVEEIDSIKKPNQKIEFKSKGKEQPFFSDRKILKNIVINLISNAIKYSGDGKKINLLAVFNNDKLQFSVIDKGIGIPVNEQERMFERFFRAKNSTNIQGTGLGLNIVKKYVEMLSGTITFESKEDIGTTFTVTLPL